INIDASRIGESGATTKADTSAVTESNGIYGDGLNGNCGIEMLDKGRFPANCITLDSDEFYSKYFDVTPNVSPQELSKKASKKDRNSDWKGEEITLEPRNNMRVNAPRATEAEKHATTHGNNHPTVKPTDLMAWLVRLITPPNGVVLDP